MFYLIAFLIVAVSVLACFAGALWSRLNGAIELLDSVRRVATHAHVLSDENLTAITALEEFWQSRGPCKVCGKHRYEADFPRDELCGAHPVNIAQGELQL